MNRWDEIEESEIEGQKIKMYRPLNEPLREITVPSEKQELDYYSHKYLNSSLLMYKILDSNWPEYMEERGDVSRLKQIRIPIGTK